MNNLATALEDQLEIALLPQGFALYQNYPNPFNPQTIINYELPIRKDVDLSVYNLLGQKVLTLVDRRQYKGYYQIEWDATDFTSGIYILRLIARGSGQNLIQTKKMILSK